VQVPAHVEYEKATSVAQALALLTRYAPGARVLAGGHSLIPMMKLRLAQPEVLIDINGIEALRYIKLAGPVAGNTAGGGSIVTDSGELRIGALARHADLLASPAAGDHFAILHDAERVIADPVVRNWGTIGGSLCQADPSEDLSAAFAALKGSMIIHGPGGSREVSAREFHTGPYETVVGPDELLTEIRLPVRPGSGSAYLKVCRRAGDWPIGAAGAAVWLADGLIADVGIGLTAVGAAHFVAAEAEEYLRGRPAEDQVLARAGEIAAEHCRPGADQRGPVEYKRHLAGELTTRVLRAAVSRARSQNPTPETQ
jgi:aerobic carbon-monoxide dehydrogenase medium subunit